MVICISLCIWFKAMTANLVRSAYPEPGSSGFAKLSPATNRCSSSSKKSRSWNGSVCGKESPNIILRRLIAYAEKIFDFSPTLAAPLRDRRQRPRRSTAAVVKSATVLFWARLGSLNAWEQLNHSSVFKTWLAEKPASADTLGRVHAGLEADGLRASLRHVYDRLKRNKALPDDQGWAVAVLDGHESSASYLRCCPGCLERTLHTTQGDRTQYYHRQVTLMLLPGAPPGRPPLRLLLDAEPQRAGEDEVTTALRLLKRALSTYPRAFDLVLADALYATAPFFNFLLQRGKHALVVLKDERRDLYQDVTGLLDQTPSQQGSYRNRQCCWWDFSDLHSWPQVQVPVRVVRSRETYSIRRQLDGLKVVQTSDWLWVTTAPATQLFTQQVVRLDTSAGTSKIMALTN